jgi:hypothetical protein
MEETESCLKNVFEIMYVTENCTLVRRNQFYVSFYWLRKPWKILKNKINDAFDVVYGVSHIG